MTIADQFPESICFIGCGNMAGAMLTGWLHAGLDKSRVTIISPNSTHGPGGIKVDRSWPDQMPQPELLILGVKPQKLGEIASLAGPLAGPDTVVMSILAGVTHQALKARFPLARSIVRVMPNMAVSIGKSVSTGFLPADERFKDIIALRISTLMEFLGQFIWLKTEDDMHAATALAGSGPAFVFRYIDALSKGAEAAGIAPDDALKMALGMVEGAAELAALSEDSPAVLADKVASPGGVTRAGLQVLDSDDALHVLVGAALLAATRRDKEMGEQFR